MRAGEPYRAFNIELACTLFEVAKAGKRVRGVLKDRFHKIRSQIRVSLNQEAPLPLLLPESPSTFRSYTSFL